MASEVDANVVVVVVALRHGDVTPGAVDEEDVTEAEGGIGRWVDVEVLVLPGTTVAGEVLLIGEAVGPLFVVMRVE